MIAFINIPVPVQKAEMDTALALEIQKEIDHAKLQGLDATRKAIISWNHNQEYNWQLIAISNETANKLLQGEFKTLNDLLNYESSIIDDFDKNITILYRTVRNEDREISIDIIETIFLN